MPRRTPKLFTVEIRNAGRRKPSVPLMLVDDQSRVKWPAAVLEAAPAERAPAKPSGRILPALNVQLPAPEPAPRPKRQRAPRMAAEAVGAIRVSEKPKVAPEPATPRPEAASLSLPPEAAETAPAPRKGRLRRPRANFKRGERWRARLPVAVVQWRGAKTP